MATFYPRLDRWLGISGTSEAERELLCERFVSLKRQLPWLYGILFANLLGLYLTVAHEVEVSGVPALAFLAVIGARGLYWLNVRPPLENPESLRRELRLTFMVCLAFCVAFSAWSMNLFWALPGPHRTEIIMFVTLAAIGSCFTLTVFPAAAKIPLLVLALPLTLSLSVSDRLTHTGMGIILTILITMTLRLLKGQEEAFVRLVSSRFAIEAEKRRALNAEKLAVAEQARVKLIANSDALTGLANRRGFFSSFDHRGGAERRNLALILVDLDGFKPINDTFGHGAGDALLVEVSRRLQGIQLRQPHVARLGGDEFAIVCQCADTDEAISVARSAVTAVNEPYSIDGRTLSISACAGVSFQGDDNLFEAMRRADIALYRSKDSGRGHVALFTSDMEQAVQRRTSIEQALREPGIDGDIEVAFQPIFHLETMEVSSFEALARWKHRKLGWISPAEFIPITEQLSALDSMSEALLRRSAKVANYWPKTARLSFNLSAVQLCSAGYGSRILAILEDVEFEAARLQLEVTETALLADFRAARENLSVLSNQGVRIVLDDFGAGYSSISYLREMRFDAVKLDGSLLTSAKDPMGGLPLLSGVLALCDALGLPCVAEHIETRHQLDSLLKLGCPFGQGFLLSPPLDAAAATSLARSGTDPNQIRAAA